MKYRKKPVVIEAFQFPFNEHTITKEFMDAVEVLQVGEQPRKFFIKTLEGIMEINLGDYVIKGVKGEFYPCKPDIFEMTYEAV